VVRMVGAQTTVYVYDAFGALAAAYSNGAMGTPPCHTCYLTFDHLGTTRLITDPKANVIARHDFLPFGEEIPGGIAGRSASQFGTGLDNINQKFTGQEGDSESSLDYFHARYFGAPLGRFLSPDPGNAGARLTVSQSWNAYAYVQNNPLNAMDPSGLDPILTAAIPTFSVTTICGGTCFDDGGGGGVSYHPPMIGADPPAFCSGAGSHGPCYSTTRQPTFKPTQQPGSNQAKPTAPSGGQQQPQRGVTFGLGVGGNADLGAVVAGAEVNTSGLVTGSVSSSGQLSGAPIWNYGATAYAGDNVYGIPAQDPASVVLGAYNRWRRDVHAREYCICGTVGGAF
jgi:RHS repeat-associated protein